MWSNFHTCNGRTRADTAVIFSLCQGPYIRPVMLWSHCQKIGKSPVCGLKIWRNFDEGRRAGSKAWPRAVPGGTGLRQGTFASGGSAAQIYANEGRISGRSCSKGIHVELNSFLPWRNNSTRTSGTRMGHAWAVPRHFPRHACPLHGIILVKK